jgi:hypothetical protein
MLEIGNGKLTLAEQRSHFALWCLMKSPLIIGSDVRALPAASMAILQNAGLIAVNQDGLGIQGTLRVAMNSSGVRQECVAPPSPPSPPLPQARLMGPSQLQASQPLAEPAAVAVGGVASVSPWVANCSHGAIGPAQRWQISDDGKSLRQQAHCLVRSGDNDNTVVVAACNGAAAAAEWEFGNVTTTVSQVRDPSDPTMCLAFNSSSLHMEKCRKETGDKQEPNDCAMGDCR